MNEHTSAPRRRRPANEAAAAMIAVFLGVFLGVVSLVPGVAFAENTVVSSEPANGSSISASPDEIIITFDEEVGDLRAITLSCEAEFVEVGPSTLSGSAKIMTIPILEAVPKGVCLLEWRVADTEGDPNGDGNISFTVQNAAPTSDGVDGDDADAAITTGTEPTNTPRAGDTADTPGKAPVIELSNVQGGTGPLWLGRLLSTLGIAIMFGSLVVIAAAWPEGVEYLITVRFVRAAWFLALIGTLLFVAAGSAAVTGSSLGSGFSPSAWTDLLDAGWSGRAALFRLVLVVASAWAAFRPDRVIDPVTQLAALGVPALATALIGIGRTDGSLPILGVGLGVAHALAMAIWVGGVILLGRVVLAGPGEEDLVHAVRGFGRLSGPAIGVTLLTGVIQMIRLDGGDLFTTGHGRVVLLKVALVAVMVFIGISARQFVAQRLVRAHELTAPMADRLRRAFGIEAMIGVGTFAASAWLLVLVPSSVNPVPTIDYAYSPQVQIAAADLDMTVRLTRLQLGVVGLGVEVRTPAAGLTGLEVVFTAPENPTIGTITQPIPLTGEGFAVLKSSALRPLRWDVAGDWTLQVNARTATGEVVQSEVIGFQVVDADGNVPTTAITVPPVVVVTIDTTDTTIAPADS